MDKYYLLVGLEKAYTALQYIASKDLNVAIGTDELRAELRNILSEELKQDAETVQLRVEERAKTFKYAR